jgi:superkiller protein 3
MLLGLSGDAASAAAVLTEAVKANANDAGAQFNLGVALQATNDFRGAEDAFRKATQLSPNFALAHNNLGLALAAKKKPGEAAAAFRKAVELQPDSLDYRDNLRKAERQIVLDRLLRAVLPKKPGP